MRSFRPFHYLSAGFLLLTHTSLMAQNISDSIKEGSASLDIRYRVETVDQDNALQNATASTIRTRLGYTTGEYELFSAHIEFEDIHKIFKDDYFTVGGNPAYSTVADPIGSELNQAYLDYTRENTKFRFGRQRIKLDNDRFVGNVGWRQNEQTYDGFSVQNTSLDHTTITFAHVTNVNQVTFSDINMSNELINVLYKGIPDSTLTAYGYFLEYDDTTNLSHKTFGARYTLTKNHFLLAAELAAQSEYKEGNNRSVSYGLIEIGYAFNDNLSLKGGHEVLGSDAGLVSFQTPLATKHAFNGWADLFLTTPNAGLEDTYISVNSKVNKFQLAAVYHDFAANSGSTDYGTELDLLASMTINKHLSGGIKLARYDADTFGVDTNKFWFWLQYAL